MVNLLAIEFDVNKPDKPGRRTVQIGGRTFIQSGNRERFIKLLAELRAKEAKRPPRPKGRGVAPQIRRDRDRGYR